MALVTLEETKRWLRVTHTEEDATIALVANAATVAVLGYVGANADPAWDETTAPGDVKVGILRTVEDLWINRGAGAPDLDPSTPAASGYLSPEVIMLLYRRRTPTVR